jgi:hypothetical protein
VHIEEAERRIREVFPTEEGSKNTLNDEETLALLDATEDAIRSGWRAPGHSLATFLFYTCAKFDPWDPPRPIVVTPTSVELFGRAVDLFRLVEDQRQDYVVLFELDSVRTRLYQEAAIVPGRLTATEIDYQEYRASLSQIPAPSMPSQRADYRERRLILERLLNGLESNSLKSALQLHLPYALHHQAVDAQFGWHGIHCTVSLQPDISRDRLRGMAVQVPGAALTPAHVTRWQGATSAVRIQLDGLLHPNYHTPALRDQAGEMKNPYEGWPSAYTFAFLLLYDFAWELRVNHQGEQHWIPAPGDIMQLQYFVVDQAGNQLDMNAVSIGGIKATFGEPGVLSLSLADLIPPPWWQRCRAQAALYLDLGDTAEALLWANIAVEALFEERVREFALNLNRPELEVEVDSPRAIWIDAEDIISQQFPEMAGRVRWPDIKRHMSIYTKLKYVHRELNLACSLSEAQKHYATISRERNSLFHGTSSVRPSAEYLVEVLQALDWLSDNFVLAKE